jgi:hypothetical protein
MRVLPAWGDVEGARQPRRLFLSVLRARAQTHIARGECSLK